MPEFQPPFEGPQFDPSTATSESRLPGNHRHLKDIPPTSPELELRIREILVRCKDQFPAVKENRMPLYFREDERHGVSVGLLNSPECQDIAEKINQLVTNENVEEVTAFFLRSSEYWIPLWYWSDVFQNKGKDLPLIGQNPTILLERVNQIKDLNDRDQECQRLYYVFRCAELYESFANDFRSALYQSLGTEDSVIKQVLADMELRIRVSFASVEMDWIQPQTTIFCLNNLIQFGLRDNAVNKDLVVPVFLQLLKRENEPFSYYIRDKMTQGHNYAEQELLLDVLEKSDRTHAACLLLQIGLSRETSETIAKRALVAAHAKLPAYCEGLKEYLHFSLSAPTSTEMSDRLSYISTIGSAASEYWGDYSICILERPLRLLHMQQIRPAEVREQLAPSVARSNFLILYGILDGRLDLLQFIDTMLVKSGESSVHRDAPSAPTDLPKFMQKELTHACVTAGFVPPGIVSPTVIDWINDHQEGSGTKINRHYHIIGFCQIIQQLTLKYATNAHEFSGARLLVRSLPQEKKEAEIDRLLTHFKLPDVHRDFFAATMKLSPLCPLDHAVDLQKSGNTFPLKAVIWEIEQCPDIRNSDSFLLRYGFNPESIKAIEKAKYSIPLLLYLKAHGVKGNHALRDMFSEVFNQVDCRDNSRWKQWRYDNTNPAVKGQIGHLFQAGLGEKWVADQFIIFRASDPSGQINEYGWLFTDDPFFLFAVGRTPSLVASCSAYDGGSYYSRSLLSYLCDSHIKIGVLYNLSEMQQSNSDLYTRLLNGNFHFDQLRYELTTGMLPYSIERTALKLCRGFATDASTAILCQPTFSNATPGKKSPVSLQLSGILNQAFSSLPIPLFEGNTHTENSHSLYVPASRSPEGQVENWDGESWLATHPKQYLVRGAPIIAPSSEFFKQVVKHYVESTSEFFPSVN